MVYKAYRKMIIWKRIEVVITGLTRNQVVLTGSWVRIPPLPPKKGLLQKQARENRSGRQKERRPDLFLGLFSTGYRFQKLPCQQEPFSLRHQAGGHELVFFPLNTPCGSAAGFLPHTLTWFCNAGFFFTNQFYRKRSERPTLFGLTSRLVF